MTTTIIDISTNNSRVEELEQKFGDPWDRNNPTGFAAILAADEQDDMLVAGEQMLDAYRLNAEFVPVKYGGRLTRIDHMIEIMRSVYRHDPCLGLGYGASSLIASVNVWTAGSQEQCHAVADLLLSNRKVACSYYELQHGNDLARIEFAAMPNGDALLLNGSKHVTTNLKRADAIVIFARTDSGVGSRSHSLILVNRENVPADKMTYLPRFMSVGMRGVQLGGIKFSDCPLPADSILGLPGQALETAIKSFQITRTALPGMFIGILDTGLRTTIRYALQRKLYGSSVASIPLTRSVFVSTFVDLLLCDCLSTVVARAIHVLPRESSVYAPAVKYLVPKLLIDAMNRLSMILGAQFYLRGGEYAIFQKLLRDLKPSGFGHVARVACQMTILPQLPRLAHRSWLSDASAPPETFQIDGNLPPLAFDNLGINAGGQDHLIGSLIAGLDKTFNESSPESREIRRLAESFLVEIRELKSKCIDLPPHELTVMASPQTYDLTSRYTVVLTASICLNLWWHNQDHHDPFLQNPAWIIAVLNRLNAQLGNEPVPLPNHLEASLFGELLHRYENARSFDLTNRYLPGWHRSFSLTP